MSTREHAEYDALYGQDFQPKPGDSHGWVQWNGTDVCIDLHCVCGYHGHVDGDFFYFYRCPKCRVAYAVGCNVKLIPLTPEQEARNEDRFVTCVLEERPT